MGFECYLLRLHGAKSSAELIEALSAFPEVRRDHSSEYMGCDRNFVIRRPLVVLEMQVTEPHPSLSCRMMLCHPPSADAEFVRLLRELMSRLSLDRVTYNDGRTQLPPAESEEFAALVMAEIASEREMWKLQMGDAEGVYDSRQVWEQLIRPRCVPAGKLADGSDSGG